MLQQGEEQRFLLGLPQKHNEAHQERGRSEHLRNQSTNGNTSPEIHTMQEGQTKAVNDLATCRASFNQDQAHSSGATLIQHEQGYHRRDQ